MESDLKITLYDEVTSTNDVAKVHAANHPNEGKYVISRKQTKGRGRYGKSFSFYYKRRTLLIFTRSC